MVVKSSTPWCPHQTLHFDKTKNQQMQIGIGTGI